MLGGDVESHFLNSPWTFLNKSLHGKEGPFKVKDKFRTSGYKDKSVTSHWVSMAKALLV